jgi:zinc protease
MTKLLLLVFILQGVLMAAEVKEIEMKESKVPVVFEKEKYLPIVSLQLVFKNAGHLSNTKDGLADMAARLMNEGTSKEGSVGFATKLDAHAVEIGAHVGRESFVIEVSSLKSEFPYAIERGEELLKDPNYTQTALDQIKYQKTGWLTSKKSDFDYIAGTALRATLFKESALGRPYDGTIESIKEISLKDIQTFISTRLGYNNVIGVVGGDITFGEAEEHLKRVLALFPEVQEQKELSIEASDKKEVVFKEEDTQQAYIYFGAPFHYSYKEKDQHLVKIAEYLLGGAGFGSRLMEEIRVKRGLTYGVYASLRLTKTASYLSGFMQTKLSTQDEAIELIQNVVDTFVKDGITQKELDDTKKFLLGSEPLRTETLSQRLNRAYNDYYYGRPLDFSKEQLKKIESVTLDEVNKFIKAHTELLDITYSIVTKKEAITTK